MVEIFLDSSDTGKMEQGEKISKNLTDTEARIISAARTLFMKEGFSSISGDRLCKEARVSKTSLYKYFGDMTGVLAAVVYNEGDIFELRIDHQPETESEFWDNLIGFGERLLNLLNNPFCLQLDRILHEEARSNQGLAVAFYENAYGRSHQDIEAVIAYGQKTGFVKRDEPAKDLADNLISMWEGLRYVKARLGLTQKPFEDPKHWSRQCVETLFHCGA